MLDNVIFEQDLASKVGGIVGGCTVTRFFCDSVILLMSAKNLKFEFCWREKNAKS